MTANLTVLVTGAAGQLGRLAVDQLVAKGGAKIIAGTRDPSKLAGLAIKGVEVRALDWTDPATLATAFAGVDRVLLISGDQLENRSENQVRAVEAAAKAGVGHIVYTSMAAPADNLRIPIAPSHDATERALAASGVPATILRNFWYTDGLVDNLKRAYAGGGQWITASGQGKVAYVTRADCAEAAVAALLAGPSTAGTHDITGPAAITVDEVAAIAGDLTGKPLTVVHIGEDQLAAGMRSAGIPEIFVQLGSRIEALNAAGGLSRVSDAFAKLTGHAPQSVREFLAANRAQLAA
jgi:NAD(P)H dehydrogenase (quinone)